LIDEDYCKMHCTKRKKVSDIFISSEWLPGNTWGEDLNDLD